MLIDNSGFCLNLEFVLCYLGFHICISYPQFEKKVCNTN